MQQPISFFSSPFASDTDPIVWIGVALCIGAITPVAPAPTILVAIVAAVLLAWNARASFELQRQRGGRVSSASVATATGRASLRRAAFLTLLAITFACGSFRAQMQIEENARAREVLLQSAAWPSRCTLVGRVNRSPTLVGGALRIEVNVTDLQCRDRDGPVLLDHVRAMLHLQSLGAVGAMPDVAVARGDLISATATLAPPYRFWNDGTGDPRPSVARRGVLLSGGADDVVVVSRAERWRVTSWIDRARQGLRERIIATFPTETSPMARALVLGEEDLANEDQRAFRRSGLAHLLAVSGMHLVLVVVGFVAAMRALLVRVSFLASTPHFEVMRIASALGVPMAWLYADLAGGSGSALRAAWMCSVMLLARALGHRSSAWRALGLSILVMAVIDPLVIFDLSFVLSALATAGILLLARPIEAAMKRRIVASVTRHSHSVTHRSTAAAAFRRRRLFVAVLSFLAKPASTTLAATIACAPAIALMTPDLPMGGLVANVVAVPIGEAAALPLCLVHGLLFMWPTAESGCAVAASGALWLVRSIARAFSWSALPVPSPTAEQLAGLAIGALVVLLGPRNRVKMVLGALAMSLVAFEGAARVYGSPRGELRVTFIDVGQGDATLIDFPDGSTMLVDAGGLVGSPLDVGERAVAPLLAARRKSAIDVVVLSHPHPDHYLGLNAALARVKVKEFWDTGQGEAEEPSALATSPSSPSPSPSPPSPYRALLGDLRARGVAIRRPGEVCGSRVMGGAIVEVLAPCPGFVPDRSANDNSFVIRVRFGERAVLLVGDAEREEEAELVARFVGSASTSSSSSSSLKADVLKVGHHGSRTSSSPEFLAVVQPRVAVISCGVRNRFGHPHAAAVDALRQTGAEVLRTDRDGSVVITTDGRDLRVRQVGRAGRPESGRQVRSTTPMYGRLR